MAEQTNLAGSGTVDANGEVTAEQIPFSIVVEWRKDATLEQMEEANVEVKKLMDGIVETHRADPENVLPAAVERITIKRI